MVTVSSVVLVVGAQDIILLLAEETVAESRFRFSPALHLFGRG